MSLSFEKKLTTATSLKIKSPEGKRSNSLLHVLSHRKTKNSLQDSALYLSGKRSTTEDMFGASAETIGSRSPKGKRRNSLIKFFGLSKSKSRSKDSVSYSSAEDIKPEFSVSAETIGSQATNPAMASPQDQSSCVQVAVRVRPESTKERGSGICIHTLEKPKEATDSYSSSPQFQTIQIGEKETSQSFHYDYVFPSSITQREFFTTCVEALVRSCLDGYNATIFAYGQTGSGKTHTIIGPLGQEDDQAGVIPRALDSIFLGLEQKVESHREEAKGSSSTDLPELNGNPFEYEVIVKFIEVYGEEILDLVDKVDQSSNHRRGKTEDKGRLRIRDGKPGEDAEVIGACKAKVQSAEEALGYLQRGMKKRRTDATASNAESSRSHAIFTLEIKQIRRNIVSTGSSLEVMTSKTHFVDLAGSERIKTAKTEGKRMLEGININQGLFALGNVISSLGNESKGKKKHVPYRDSNLTRLLKGSLGGNHRTIMIACVSPSLSNQSESMSTLRYANRAKNIKNNAKVNIDPNSKVIKGLKDQVTTLAMELLRLRRTGMGDDDCPFSDEFLDGLISASGGTGSRSLSESSIPSVAFIPNETSKGTDSRKKNTPTDPSARSLMSKESFCTATSEGSLSIDETESFEPIDEMSNNIKNTAKVSSFRDLLHRSANELMHNARLRDMEESFANHEHKTSHVDRPRSLIQDKLYTSIRDLSLLEEVDEGEEEDDDDDNDDEKIHGKSLTIEERRAAFSMKYIDENDENQDDEGDEKDEEEKGVENHLSEKNELKSSYDAKSMKLERHEYKKIALYNTLLMSLRYIKKGTWTRPTSAPQNEDLTRIMKEYNNGYEALKIERKINLMKSKVKSYRNEKKFLDGIIDQLESHSLNSVEVSNSIANTEREIVRLEQKIDDLLISSRN